MKKILFLLLLFFLITKIPSRKFDVDTQFLTEYCIQNGYDENYCILVDFSKPQGVKRFCIYDLQNKKVVSKSLCAQGRGKENNIFNHNFSNTPGTNYSSLGKYRIGNLVKMSNPYFGEGYLVYGLDSTNSNALKRGILIHKGNLNFEVFPFPCIPASKGCFAISSKMMKNIEELKKTTKKPILLYAYV